MVTSTEPLEVQVEGEYMNPAVGENWVGEVIIPASVQDLEGYTYAVTGISNYAFNYCSKVTSVNISNSVKRIGYSAFAGCTNLTDINLPDGLTKIEDQTFSGCTSLASITIPNTVTSIGWMSFAYCRSLTKLVIPKSVTAIDGHSNIGAFAGCSGLESIIVEEGNPVFDSRDNCNAIINQWNTIILGCKNTVFPKTVESIGRYSFWGCTGLTSLSIPSWISSIGGEAFKDCLGLTSITIPKTVTFLGDSPYSGNVFTGCRNLTSIIVEEGNPIYDSRDNCNAIIEKKSNKLISGCQTTLIPNSVQIIESRSFYDITSLESIEIPKGVTEIKREAFYNCNNLTSLSFPRTLIYIRDEAFSGCSSLTEIRIPLSVKAIGDNALSCENLISVTSEMSEPMDIGSYAFGYRGTRKHYIPFLYVPIGTKEKYMVAKGWNVFTNIEEIDMGISVSGDVTKDGHIDTKDLMEIVNAMMGKASDGIDINAADLNGDGIINIADIIQIVNLIFNNQ